MKRTLTTLGALAALAGAAHAGEVSQTVDVNITPGNFIQTFSLDGFDSQEGNRTLTGVRFQLDTEFHADLTAQNFSDFPIASGDWEVLPGFTMFFTAEPTGRGDDGGGPSIFAGIGGIGFDSFTGDLPAGSGGPFGAPGTLDFERSGQLTSDFLDDGESALSFFSQFSEITSSLSPFSFPELFGPPGANLGLAADITQTGTLTVVYEFTEIPAPGAAALIGLAGLGATRRRR